MILNPGLAFFIPIFTVFVSLILNEFQELSVADQHLARFKFFHVKRLHPKLIVPPVSISIVNLFRPFEFDGRNSFHGILWDFFTIDNKIRTILQSWALFDVFDIQHSYDRWSSFKVNPFMLETHDKSPAIRVPTYVQINGVQNTKNFLNNLFSELFDFLYSWPPSAAVSQIIPLHLIHSDCHDGFHIWIHPISDNPFIKKLINIERSRMLIVENKWMPERLWTNIKAFLISD